MITTYRSLFDFKPELNEKIGLFSSLFKEQNETVWFCQKTLVDVYNVHFLLE